LQPLCPQLFQTPEYDDTKTREREEEEEEEEEEELRPILLHTVSAPTT
jgi:hypothetical protein